MSDSETDLAPADRLAALLYQYVNLYERWSEDRQVFAKKGAALSALIEDIKAEVDRLASVDELVRESLVRELEPVIRVVKETIVKTATDEAKNSLWEVVQQLSTVVHETEVVLRDSQKEVGQSRWLWFGVTALSALLSGFVFAWWLLPANLYQLSDHQIALLHVGSNFVTSLSHLSTKEQQQLLDKLKSSEENPVNRSTN